MSTVATFLDTIHDVDLENASSPFTKTKAHKMYAAENKDNFNANKAYRSSACALVVTG